jgi:site-specific DNA-cytosine methylase
MESHGESIKPVLRELITWTLPKEGITLLKLFGGIGTGLKALLQSRTVVRRYFYIDIDPIARQVVALRTMELTTKFPQQFTTTAWKVSLTFLPSDIRLIQKKHKELFGPMDLIILGWECQGFLVAGFGKGLTDTRSDLFMDMVRLIT